MIIRPLPEYLLNREDTIASHIRNCHEAAINAANMACYGSGWGGPGEEAFAKLREASNLLVREIDKQIIEDILIDVDFHESPDGKLYGGDYIVTGHGITIRVPDDWSGTQIARFHNRIADQLEGYDGPSDCFEDGYNAYGYVSIRY